MLAELELVSLDRDLPALAVTGEARTALERSPAFRVYANDTRTDSDSSTTQIHFSKQHRPSDGCHADSGPRARRWTA